MRHRELPPDERAMQDARRAAHVVTRLNRVRSLGEWAPSTALVSRLGLYEPYLRPKGRDGASVETSWGTVSVSGAVGQRHASLMECLFWRMTAAEPQDDGSLLVVAPEAAVCRDLSSLSKASPSTPKLLLDAMAEATFSPSMKRLAPWDPDGEAPSQYLFGPFVEGWKRVRLPLESPVMDNGKVVFDSQYELQVRIGRGLATLMTYDGAPLSACRLPLVQIHNGPVQAVARWLLAQSPLIDKQPKGGGWYYVRHAIADLCGARPSRWMDQQIAACRQVPAQIWDALGIEVCETVTCTSRRADGGGRPQTDCKLRLAPELLLAPEESRKS